MMSKIIFTLLTFCFCTTHASAQSYTPNSYIETYKQIAIEEMHRSGIPASITLAQGLLESEFGNSDLVQRSNNHFGIKCKREWTGASVTHTDDAPNECFRAYPSARDSYEDHSNYLKNSARYDKLFALAKDDYKGWAHGLKKAGYATNPRYPTLLINNIEKYNLQQYDGEDTEENTLFASGNVINAEQNITKIEMESKSPPLNPGLQKQVKGNNRFNGLKAIFAAANTSLLAIATNADLSLSKLLDYNDLTKDGLLPVSQYIYLEKKNKEGNRPVYMVTQPVEYLYDIAQANAIQLEALLSYNNLAATSALKKGTVVRLQKNADLTSRGVGK